MKWRWKGGNPWKTKRGEETWIETEREREWERRLEEEVRSRSACSTPVSHVRCTRERTFTGHFQISLPSTAALECSGIFPLPSSSLSYRPFIRNGIRLWCRRAYLFNIRRGFSTVFRPLEAPRFSKGQIPYRSSHSYRILASRIRRRRHNDDDFLMRAQWERQTRRVVAWYSCSMFREDWTKIWLERRIRKLGGKY